MLNMLMFISCFQYTLHTVFKHHLFNSNDRQTETVLDLKIMLETHILSLQTVQGVTRSSSQMATK